MSKITNNYNSRVTGNTRNCSVNNKYMTGSENTWGALKELHKWQKRHLKYSLLQSDVPELSYNFTTQKDTNKINIDKKNKIYTSDKSKDLNIQPAYKNRYSCNSLHSIANPNIWNFVDVSFLLQHQQLARFHQEKLLDNLQHRKLNVNVNYNIVVLMIKWNSYHGKTKWIFKFSFQDYSQIFQSNRISNVFQNYTTVLHLFWESAPSYRSRHWVKDSNIHQQQSEQPTCRASPMAT